MTNQPAEVPTLKPCPFCGGEAEIIRLGAARQSMQIACSNCATFVESGDVCGLTNPKEYRWNTREVERALLTSCRNLLAIVRLQNGNLHEDINDIQDAALAAIKAADPSDESKPLLRAAIKSATEETKS